MPPRKYPPIPRPPVVMARPVTRPRPNAAPRPNPGSWNPGPGPGSWSNAAPGPVAGSAPGGVRVRADFRINKPAIIGLAALLGSAVAYWGLAGAVGHDSARLLIGAGVVAAVCVWVWRAATNVPPAVTLERSRQTQRTALTRMYQDTNATYRDRLRAVQLLIELENKIETPARD